MRSSKNPHRPRGGPGFHTRDSHSKFKNSALLHKTQVTDSYSHLTSLEISSNALSFIGILFQVTRPHWNSLLMNFNSLGNLFQAPRRATRPVRHQAPRMTIRPVGHQAPHKAIRPVGHQTSRRAIHPVEHRAPRRAILFS